MSSSSPPSLSPAMREPVVPAPSDDEPTEGDSLTERFYAALPLFVVGGACVAAAVYLYVSGAATTVGGNGSVHLRPWVLFLALAITGIAAGTIVLLDQEATTTTGSAEDLPAAPRPAPAVLAKPP
jgi:hypothetical protein